jgi:hypothetical protein
MAGIGEHHAAVDRRQESHELAPRFEHRAVPLHSVRRIYTVCTENLIRVDDVMESPKLVE